MSLLTECGGGATPECSGNGQSTQLIQPQEGRCGGGMNSVCVRGSGGGGGGSSFKTRGVI